MTTITVRRDGNLLPKKVDRNQSAFFRGCEALGGGGVDYHDAGEGRPDCVLYGDRPYETGEFVLAEIKMLNGIITGPEHKFLAKHSTAIVVLDSFAALLDFWAVDPELARAKVAMGAYLDELLAKGIPIPDEDWKVAQGMGIT